MSTIENRYDFVYLFDCQDGNPNGDPDSDNSPRFDLETFQGLVSDVCLKRKVRDYVLYSQPESGAEENWRYDIFVVSGNTLESRQRLPFEKLNGSGKLEPKGKDTKPTDIERARRWMCDHFFDDLNRSVIRLSQTKNSSPRNVPLNSAALAALKEQKTIVAHSSGDTVFPLPGPSADCRWWFLPALKEARVSGYTWHSNRHTFCSWLAMAGGYMKDIQTLAGRPQDAHDSCALCAPLAGRCVSQLREHHHRW